MPSVPKTATLSEQASVLDRLDDAKRHAVIVAVEADQIGVLLQDVVAAS